MLCRSARVPNLRCYVALVASAVGDRDVLNSPYGVVQADSTVPWVPTPVRDECGDLPHPRLRASWLVVLSRHPVGRPRLGVHSPVADLMGFSALALVTRNDLLGNPQPSEEA